jgi:hypothetical protein
MTMIVITGLCLLVLFPTRGISQANNGVPVADALQIEKLVARVDPATVKIEVKRIEIESSDDNSDQAGVLGLRRDIWNWDNRQSRWPDRHK